MPINPAIYVNEGTRIASRAAHMHLYVCCFDVVFLTIGLRNFRRRILS